MKKLFTLICLGAVSATILTAQSTSSATTSPFIWEAAVKADAPASFTPPAAMGGTSLVSTPPLYYSAQRDVPPLPFNSHPELALFDIGNNSFMYDDSNVDYFSLFTENALAGQGVGEMSSMSSPSPCNPCSTNGGGGGGAPYSGPPAYSYSSTQLWVKITSTNTTNFLLEVNNTVSNKTYGVLAKGSIDTDPLNTWSLVTVFRSTTTKTQFLGNASAATRFFAAVDLDSYVGPSVSIVSPAGGTTVSNDVPLQIRVTDILPLSSVKVFVDAVEVGVIQSGQNGTTTVPTTWFGNGQHQIWLAVVNEGVPVDTDGNGLADDISVFQKWTSVTVNFTNAVSMQNYSPLYSGASSLTFQYSATSLHDYKFEVFKTNGTLLHITNGQFSGSLSRQWNFKDLSGNTVTDGVYTVSLTYSNAAAAAAKKVIITNFVDNGVDVGNYVVSYGEWPTASYNTALSDMNAYISVRINAAAYFNDDIIGSGREDYNAPYVDFSSDPFKIRPATQVAELTALTNALKDFGTGAWLYEGHANGKVMIPGIDGYLTVSLTATQVARCLGSEFIPAGKGQVPVKYGRRLFSTMLTGCSAASSDSQWPPATGTPVGVDQINNTQIKKTAFVGFTYLSYVPYKYAWISRIHGEWIDGGDYDTPLSTAVSRANTAYPGVLPWGPTVLGYPPLKYDANESW